jgi:hypothetical protein
MYKVVSYSIFRYSISISIPCLLLILCIFRFVFMQYSTIYSVASFRYVCLILILLLSHPTPTTRFSQSDPLMDHSY